MGFCVFNNAGLAARTYCLETGRSALIADIDFHHGNGTQALVGDGLSYLSTHASPEYPWTGDATENHLSAGGSLMNVPLPVTGIATEAFVAIWTQSLRRMAQRVRPSLLVVSAGFDFVAGDPIGDLGVAVSATRQIGRIVREIATEYCGDRALFVLEGGYNPAILAACVIETIRGFEEGLEVERMDHASIPGAQRAIVDALERPHAVY
jgi:acetoin utilization deacetylase AcuC-like enzyme